MAHGTEDQRLRYLPAILSADGDLVPALQRARRRERPGLPLTKAVPVDGGYLVTGRKVWTSYAQFATWGLCLARTDADAPRPQQGISALIVDMSDPGVEIRPLVQMTGDAEFNEVFLTDVFVPSEHLVGIEGQGWTVAGSTLAHERGTNFPFKEQVVHETYLARLYDEARPTGPWTTRWWPTRLAQAYIDLGVLRLHNLRTLTRLGRGEEPGPESSWVKLTWTTMTQRLSRRGLLVTGRDAVVGRVRPVGAPVAVEPGGQHRRGDLAGAARTSSPGGSWACRADWRRAPLAGTAEVRHARSGARVRPNLSHARKGVVGASGGQQPRRGANGSRRRDRGGRRGPSHTARDDSCRRGAEILVYRPQLQHYALLFGDLEAAAHVAVFVPGVGDGSNLCQDWIPDAAQPLSGQHRDRRRPVEGLRQPGRRPGRRGRVDRMRRGALDRAAHDLTEFVGSLALAPEQSLTVIAHSFGSIVIGAALADAGLEVTDVVVAGSPGMTVDGLRQLHLQQGALLRRAGAGRRHRRAGRLRARPGVAALRRHPHEHERAGSSARRAASHYFEPGSAALENMADVVTGHYSDILRHRAAFPEIAGGLVAWALRMPVVPLRVAGRHYRAPGSAS